MTFPPLLYSFVAKIGLRKGRPADFSGHSPRALSFAAADTRTQPMRGKAVNWVHTSPSIYERCRQSTQPGARELLLVLLNFYIFTRLLNEQANCICYQATVTGSRVIFCPPLAHIHIYSWPFLFMQEHTATYSLPPTHICFHASVYLAPLYPSLF